MKIEDVLIGYFLKENVTSQCDGTLFRCRKTTENGTLYEIVYVDTSGKWLEESYSDFLESVVVNDFYENDGFLQWNFYFYVVAETDIIKKNLERKWIIENNDTFTRKEVISPEGLQKKLDSISNLTQQILTQLPTDLYGTWVNCLRENELFFVYNDVEYPHYTNHVENYINGDSFNDIEFSEDTISTNLVNEASFQNISSLTLDTFREYPILNHPTIEVASVNLITGPNAVGKTSLFDAIELALTGSLDSSKTQPPKSSKFKIHVATNKGTTLKYPLNLDIRKQRDKLWYKSGMAKGNALNKNYHKFNYYDCDAAYKLNDNTANPYQVIVDIALGVGVNKLEARIIGFKNRFEDEDSKLGKKLEELQEKINAKKHEIESKRTIPNTIQDYKYSLIEILTKSGWIKLYGVDDEIPVAILDSEIHSILNAIKSIESSGIDLKTATTQDVIAMFDQLRDKNVLLKEIKKRVHTAERKQDALRKSIADIDVALGLTTELLSYYQHNNFDRFLGLQDKIQTLEKEVEKAKDIEERIDTLGLHEFLRSISKESGTIGPFEANLQQQKLEAEQQRQQKDLSIHEIEKGFEETTVIINNIRNYAKNFIHLHPSLEKCPLCNTNFKEGELAVVIQKESDLLSEPALLTALRGERDSLSKKVRDLNKEIEQISGLKEINILLSSGSPTDISLSVLVKALEDMTNISTQHAETLEELKSIQYQFSSADLSEKRFKEVTLQLNNIATLTDNSLPELLAYNGRISLEKNNEEIALRDIAAIIQGASREVEELLGDTQSEIQLLNSLEVYTNVHKNIEILKKYFQIVETDLIAKLKDDCSKIENIFNTYRDAVNRMSLQNDLLESISNDIKQLEISMEDIVVKKNRTNFASVTLAAILQQYNKNKVLENYLIENKNRIFNIFNFIHSPKEFTGLDFFANDNENDKDSTKADNTYGIFLTDLNNNRRELNEISTGQKTALALSIFLSLNNLLIDAPNIILFDDPVAHVDDMNMLSFVDYLRELVIKSGLQIFFATANNDLTFLFRKKFEFLGDNFKMISLQRNTASPAITEG